MKLKRLLLLFFTMFFVTSCETQKAYQSSDNYNFVVEYADQSQNIEFKKTTKEEMDKITKPMIPFEEILRKIKYPETMRMNKTEATVRLRLFISENGDIKKIVILNKPDQSFINACLAAFKEVKCNPA